MSTQPNPSHTSARDLVITRDVVVIGCSAGGVEALPRLLQQLPATFPATIAIVQHMAATENPYLVQILARSSSLPVGWAEQGQRMERGKVYVGPPDVHLLFSDDYFRLARGPRENHARPSIDKLFRSAAATHGSRVIGVLLTGMLDDGVSGLRAIQASGGLAIVQDPADAAFPELPRQALLALEPERTLPIDGIAQALQAYVVQPVAVSGIPTAIAFEAELDRSGPVDADRLRELGMQTPIACPDCHGPLWQIGDEQQRRFRCYLGHVASARQLVDDSAAQVEGALWSALRALNDRAHTLEVLAADADKIGNTPSAETYTVRAREARAQAELMRRFMLDLSRTRSP